MNAFAFSRGEFVELTGWSLLNLKQLHRFKINKEQQEQPSLGAGSAFAFADLVPTSSLSPLPVASCRSRDPSGGFDNLGKGAQRRSEPLPRLSKVPGFTSEQHETRRVEGKAPLAPSREEASAFAFDANQVQGVSVSTGRGINGRGPNKTVSSFCLGGSRLCRESQLYTGTNKHAPGWGRVIMAARPLFPAPLPRGERGDDKGQGPLVLDLRGFGGNYSPQEAFAFKTLPKMSRLRRTVTGNGGDKTALCFGSIHDWPDADSLGNWVYPVQDLK
jgi:hypothetical protein